MKLCCMPRHMQEQGGHAPALLALHDAASTYPVHVEVAEAQRVVHLHLVWKGSSEGTVSWRP